MKLTLPRLKQIIKEELEKLTGGDGPGGQWRLTAEPAMDILADEAASNPALVYDANPDVDGTREGVLSRLSDPETGAFVELSLRESDQVVVRWAASRARPKVSVLKGDSRDDRTMMDVVDDAFGDV
jgi:hypothetical protein